MASPTRQDQDQMVDAVRRMVDGVESGLSPDAAGIKVAAAMRLSPGRIELMANAYNVAAADDVRTSGTTALEKLSHAEFADPDKIIHAVYSRPLDTAIAKTASIGLDAPPSWLETRSRTKQADIAERNRAYQLESLDPVGGAVIAKEKAEKRTKQAEDRKKHAAIHAAEQDLRTARDKAAEARMDLEVAMRKVASFWRGSTPEVPMAAVEASAIRKHGELAVDLFDQVHSETGKRWKRAAEGSVRSPVSLVGRPETRAVDTAFDKTAAYLEAAGTIPLAEAKLAEAKTAYREQFKEAAGPVAGTVYGALLGAGLSRAVGGPMASQLRQDAIDSAIAKLDDPGHLEELRDVKARADLARAMTDPSSPLSKHSPESVIQQYNQLMDAAPSVAAHPYLWEPILNKSMVGGVEPFEAMQTAKLETDFRRSQQSSQPAPRPAATAQPFMM